MKSNMRALTTIHSLDCIILIFIVQISVIRSFTSRILTTETRRPLLLPSTVSLWQRKPIEKYNKPVLCMVKGDGKKNRKKGHSILKNTESTVPLALPTESLPLRVTNSINVPVKRQIQWAKMNQQYMKSDNSFRQIRKRSSYRKQLDEEEHQTMLGERKQRNSEVDWDVILSNNNHTSECGPLMLVDGYNVIYQWSRLKKHMIKGNTQMARDLLVRDLEELHCYKGWRIECVFDGFGRNVKGALGDSPGNVDRVSLSDRQFKRDDTGRGVRIVFSGVGASADSYIEKRCLDAKDITQGKTTGSLIIVSNDSMIRLVGTGVGALCMSSDRLVDELKAVKKVTEYRVEAAMAIANGGYVRPEGLRNKSSSKHTATERPNVLMYGVAGVANSVGISEVDGRQVMNTLRRGQFIIEDKRLRKSKSKSRNTIVESHPVDVGTNLENSSKRISKLGNLVKGIDPPPL